MPTPTNQLLSRTIYTTDGVTTVWNFAFSGGYLDVAHIKAHTETPTGLLTVITVTAPMVVGPYQLQITPALAAGDTLTIYRDTPKDLPLVDFTDESGFSEIALDTNAKQAVFIAAETVDTVENSNSFDANASAQAALAAQAAAEAAVVSATAQVALAAAEAANALASANAAAATPVAAPTTAAASKATPVDADYIPLIDSTASFILKKLTWVNIKATLKTYLDTLYAVRGPIASSGITGAAASGANTDITSLGSIASINGGQLAGLRNRIINGGMQVAQRTAPMLSSAWQYGQVDRNMVTVLSGTGISSTIVQSALAGFSSGVACGTVNGSWTAGVFAVQQRLEAKNTVDLNSKTITVSCKVYQNTGGARNFAFQILSPTAADNHASQNLLAASGVTSVPSGVVTSLSYTYTLGAAEATNGLAVIVYDASAANTVVTKTYLVGDLQLEIGSVASAFEVRPYGMELALCQRYYEVSTSFQLFSGYVNIGSGYHNVVRYQVTKRAIPSVVTFVDVWNSGFPAIAPTLSGGFADGFNVVKTANATNVAGYYQYSWTSSAEL